MPVGVPLTPIAVAVRVTADLALEGFEFDCRDTVVPFFTTCEAAFETDEQVFDYRLRVTDDQGQVTEIDDPYRYGRVLGALDLHLLGEGTHLRAWEKLGSHALTIGEATGSNDWDVGTGVNDSRQQGDQRF